MGEEPVLSLFDEPKPVVKKPDEPKTEHRLYDAMRIRFVPKMTSDLTATEAAVRNAYFEKARCGHLQWKNDSDRPGRTYTIKR